MAVVVTFIHLTTQLMVDEGLLEREKAVNSYSWPFPFHKDHHKPSPSIPRTIIIKRGIEGMDLEGKMLLSSLGLSSTYSRRVLSLMGGCCYLNIRFPFL